MGRMLEVSPSTCPIWNLDCKSLRRDIDADVYVVAASSRAGGDYEITYDALDEVQRMDESGRTRVNSILVEQWMKGIAVPRLTKDDLLRASEKQSLPVHERAERLLRLLVKESSQIGQELLFWGDEPNGLSALGWSESTSWQEVQFLTEYLVDQGWANRGSAGRNTSALQVVVEVPGYRRMEELETNPASSQCFVAMWFDPRMDDARDKGIIPAIEDAGYTASIINQMPDLIGRIEDAIIAEIRRSRFMVADFSHGDEGVRGSVYYEAGFAHALGLPVIFTRHKNGEGVVHFDTDHFYRIEWETPEDLRKQLTEKIEAAIGDGPNKSRKG